MKQKKISFTAKIGMWLSTCDNSISHFLTPCHIRKYSILGYSMIIPIILAVFSSYIFIGYFFETSLFQQLIISLIYGLIIAIIDRLIMNYLMHNKRYSMVNIFLRIGLAAILAFLVSIPFELLLFKDEVYAKIQSEKYASIESVDNEAEGKIKQVEEYYRYKRDSISQLITDKSNILQEYRDKVENLQNIYLEEMDGRSTSGIIGVGKLAKAKKELLDAEINSLNQVTGQTQDEVFKLEKEINQLAMIENKKIEKEENSKNDKISNLDDTISMGFVASYKTLSKLANQHFIIGLLLWVIRLIIVLLDLLPLITKCLWKEDEHYHYLLNKATENQNILSKWSYETNQRKVVLEQKYLRLVKEISMEFQTIKSLDEATYNKLCQTLNEKYRELIIKEKFLDKAMGFKTPKYSEILNEHILTQ